MQSISARIMWFVVAAAAIVFLIVAVVLDHAVQKPLRSEFDRQLLFRGQGLTLLTDFDETGEVEFDFEPDSMPSFGEHAHRAEYFILKTMDGDEIARSESLVNEFSDVFAESPPGPNGPEFRIRTLPNGRQIRLLSMVFEPLIDFDPEESDTESGSPLPDPGPPPTLHLVVARGTEAFDSLVNRIRLILAAGLISLLGALVVLVRLGVMRGLKPIRTLASEVARLNEERLDIRVSTPVNASELLPVSNQINKALGQLDDAFYRERSFSGNVAHELRTPIAELRSYAEIGKRWPQDGELVEKFFAELVDLSGDMERTVVNLLMLSRLDSGSVETDQADVNVSELIDRVWSKLTSEASERAMGLDVRIPDTLSVNTDADKLHLIMNNLMSNAIAHSPTGDSIVVETVVHDETVSLAVSNHTEHLSAGDLNVMFNRFWRKDKARTSGRHAGLGLAIVKALSDVLGVSVKPELSEGNRFRVILDGFVPTPSARM